jgi:hypothetical protein
MRDIHVRSDQKRRLEDLFIGAFSAAAAAMEGGGLRDGTWGKKSYGKTAFNR